MITAATARRDAGLTALGLAAAVAASWAWLAAGAGLGGTGAMPGMDAQGTMTAMDMPPGWTPGHAALMFGMWAVMMVAMMLPNAAQAVLGTARSGGLASAAWFTAGYLAVWMGFAAAATLAQWALDAGRLLSDGMAVRSAVAAGLIVAVAGLYQATPLKRGCLDLCHRLCDDVPGAQRGPAWDPARAGLRYGVSCLGCCAALMALLFVGGLMNVLWIVGITVWVLAERTFRWGGRLAWLGAAGLVAAGITETVMALARA